MLIICYPFSYEVKIAKSIKFKGSASCDFSTWNDKSLQARTATAEQLNTSKSIPISCLKVIKMLSENRFELGYCSNNRKDKESFKVWNCLRSKSTVLLLLSLFMLEVLAAMGLGIYHYIQQQDGTLQPLFGTTTNCYQFQSRTGEKFT